MADTSMADRAGRRRETDRLTTVLRQTQDPDRQRGLRCEMAAVNRCVALSVAARYRGRGVADDDLQQIACVGLVHAVDRFDPGLGHDFLSFAVPTIRGEIRRYFRDQGWMVRPPRRLQELQSRLQRSAEDLRRRLQREPSEEELRAEVGIGEREHDEVLRAYGAFRPVSLDVPLDPSSHTTLSDLIGDGSPSPMEAAEARAVLAPLLATLSEQDRHILTWRFWDDLSQREIGDRIAMTQVQVSRRLSRIMERLSELAQADRSVA